MKLNSVSMRRWMLWGALISGIINVFDMGVSCFATAFWLWTGLLLEPKTDLGYTRKTGPLREGARAFLVLAVTLFIETVFSLSVYGLGMNNSAYGVICFISLPLLAQCIADRLYTLSISVKICCIVGLLFSGMFILFIF